MTRRSGPRRCRSTRPTRRRPTRSSRDRAGAAGAAWTLESRQDLDQGRTATDQRADREEQPETKGFPESKCCRHASSERRRTNRSGSWMRPMRSMAATDPAKTEPMTSSAT